MTALAEVTPLPPLAAASNPLWADYDVALCDLDGVLYLGTHAVPHAAAALAEARTHGMRAAFVTNNASRTPETVAEHLRELGIPAEPADVVTSAMAVVRMLRAQLPAGAAVLVAGAEGLRREVTAAGFRLVTSADDDPAAVALGYDPLIDYPRLAEAALAVHRGACWIAANCDATVPTVRGPLPGMGSLAALVATATGRRPQVAGKPERALHAESVQRSGARRPLVVGDRLDTDVEGADRAGVPSLLVLTGITGPVDLLGAPAGRRPTFLGADLRALGMAHLGADAGRCGGWTAELANGVVSLSGSGDPLDALRAACSLLWAAQDAGDPYDPEQAAAALPPWESGPAAAATG